MSKKSKAYSISKMGLQPPDNRKAFYAGWEANPNNSAVAVNKQMLEVLKFIQYGMQADYIKSKPLPCFSNPNAESPDLHHPLAQVKAAIAAAEGVR